VTRTRKVAGSVFLSLTSQVAAMVVGLWLTRFILFRLGQHDYGVWLIILQSLGYVALADIGVVAVLPRQTAFVTGKDAPPDALPTLVGETARLVLWQTPIVMGLCVVAWLLFPHHGTWTTSHGPLAAMLAIFAIAFPLRLFPAILQGLQDLVFLGWLQLATWLLNTIVVVSALWAGLGLYALALAWAATQIIPPLVGWHRLRTVHRHALPARLPPLTWPDARRHLASALWVSLGQMSNALSSGADVLIVGAVLGPSVVVPYVITLKLITVIGNLPVTVAHAAGPGLSQMRVGESRHDLRRATDALAQAVLAATGVVACVIVAVNRGFVGWWVGPDRYAGALITLVGVALMLLRHYGTTVVFAVYSFGHERRLAIVGIVQGAVSVSLSIVLVKTIGLVGALIGPIAAEFLVVLPGVLPVLARETDTTVSGLLLRQLPFALRLGLALALGAALGSWLAPTAPLLLAVTSLLAAAAYVALIAPVALRPPLREYVVQIAHVVRARLGLAPAPPTVPPPAPAVP